MNRTFKIRYIICLTASIVLSAVVFSLFFVFGQSGMLGKVITPKQKAMPDQVSAVITQKDEKELLRESIKKYEAYLASPYLISVTKETALPEDYSVDITTIPDFPEISLETNAAQKLNEFLSEAKAKNIAFTVFAGYRSAEEQQQIYNKKRESVKAAGFTDEKIIEQKTQLSTDLPGHSEHQTGLAVDIGQTTSDVSSEVVLTEFYKYAKENIYKYGFIISYPENSYTGYEFMPWHFRYIGDPEQAKYINEKNISLQSYIEYLQAQIQANRTRLEELENAK
ncbi:MAG: hypothetical protein DBX47_02210 [Clostridiales bacterium]|nr:MAG: hypothetical protein DBX47_02210 [Clostridiales bacterium]